jgi:hypothetical protein
MMRPVGNWLVQSRKRIFLDMHLPAWDGKGIAEALDPRKTAAAIADAGADSAVIFAKCQYGNFYTQVPGERLHPGLRTTDFLEETAAALRARGIRTIAYYSVSWDERFADERPEWLAVTAQGSTEPAPFRWRTLCINGPYAEVVERHLGAIARKPIDGIWLDMTIVGDGRCYCPRCREAFAARFGREPPVSSHDPGFGDFLRFRYDLVESFYARVRSMLREVSPGLAFTNNYWGYPWSSASMGSRAIGATAVADFVTGEAYADWTGIRSVSMLPIFLRSAAAGRPFEALIGTGTNTWDYTRKPKAYLSFEAFSLFAHGAVVNVDDEPFHDGRLDETLYRGDLREIFAAITRVSESVRGRRARFASIFHSQRTKDAAADQRDFVRDVSGAFRLLRDLRLDVDFVFDEAPDGIAEAGPLLVLPGVTRLAIAEWRAIESFMRAGGLVVAAGGLDGDDEVRAALGGLGIGAGIPAEHSLSYLRHPDAGPRDILVRGRAVLHRPGAGLPAGGAAGDVVEPICETSPRTFFHNNLPAPYRASGVPALLEADVGRGALAVLPQPVFRHYAKEPSPALRGLVRQIAARHLRPPRVRLGIPLRMDFSVVETEDAVYVHLLNPSVEPSLCCGLMDTYDGAFERSYEYMEEEVPVHDLRILVRRDRLGKVSTLREGSAVETHRGAAGWEIVVKRVSLYEIVKIELGRGAWLEEGDWSWP